MISVGITEAKANFAKFVELARTGETVTITMGHYGAVRDSDSQPDADQAGEEADWVYGDTGVCLGRCFLGSRCRKVGMAMAIDGFEKGLVEMTNHQLWSG